MRFRAAVTSFAALSCVGLAGYAGMLLSDPSTPAQKDTQLTGAQWTVESSADYGRTWTSPLDADGQGVFPVQARLSALANQNFYQPITLRNTVGTHTATEVRIEPAMLIAGDPAQAAQVKIRMAYSPEGYCAASVFEATADREPAATAAPLGTQRPLPSVTLDAATSSTPSSSETVCIEFSMDRSSAPTAPGEVTVAWPLKASPVDAPAGERNDNA